eukprot:TRINITY_DN1134_c0_g3_i1.p1 TRINITY_DN1134_c0_g3~~TRINITY_DN1134_c0_g3_i1.p1  ORF type:complete len:332 (+),score=117.54 TRINITY_DN1134_c0_g3_i1:57-1052(+)
MLRTVISKQRNYSKLSNLFQNSLPKNGSSYNNYSIIFQTNNKSLLNKKTSIIDNSVNGVNGLTVKNNVSIETIKDVNALKQLLNRNQYIKVRKELEKDPRYRITTDEFNSICVKNGITDEDRSKFLKGLIDAAVVVQLEQASNYVYLKPGKLTANMLKVLDPDATETHKMIEKKTKELKDLKAEHTKLKEIKDLLDAQAGGAATRNIWIGATAMVTQLAVVARLTWWELSWDIMEPITYLITYATSVLGILYFGFTRTEYTYESLWDRIAHRKKQKLYIKNNFNEHKFNQIALDIKDVEFTLKELGAPLQTAPHQDNLLEPEVEEEVVQAK